jgi:hypothetical protein
VNDAFISFVYESAANLSPVWGTRKRRGAAIRPPLAREAASAGGVQWAATRTSLRRLRPIRSNADPPAALNSTAIPVVAIVEFLARGRDGIEVSMRFVHVWTVREGQIVRFRGFGTFGEALEAVGRQE